MVPARRLELGRIPVRVRAVIVIQTVRLGPKNNLKNILPAQGGESAGGHKTAGGCQAVFGKIMSKQIVEPSFNGHLGVMDKLIGAVKRRFNIDPHFDVLILHARYRLKFPSNIRRFVLREFSVGLGALELGVVNLGIDLALDHLGSSGNGFRRGDRKTVNKFTYYRQIGTGFILRTRFGLTSALLNRCQGLCFFG